MDIKIKYHEGSSKIEKIKCGDWIDLRASETVSFFVGDDAIIPLGISMKLPEGYEAHIVPRSSTFKKWGIIQANSIGIVDNSYSGTGDIWKFHAIAFKNTTIHKGDRICQFRIMKKQPEFSFVECDVLDAEDRGGFGSTGSN